MQDAKAIKRCTITGWIRPERRKNKMGMNLEEAYKVMRQQQSELHRWKRKCIEAQSHCYEILFPDEMKDADELKAQVYYLTNELKKVIEQRDHFKSRVGAVAKLLNHGGDEDGKERSQNK